MPAGERAFAVARVVDQASGAPAVAELEGSPVNGAAWVRHRRIGSSPTSLRFSGRSTGFRRTQVCDDDRISPLRLVIDDPAAWSAHPQLRVRVTVLAGAGDVQQHRSSLRVEMAQFGKVRLPARRRCRQIGQPRRR